VVCVVVENINYVMATTCEQIIALLSIDHEQLFVSPEYFFLALIKFCTVAIENNILDLDKPKYLKALILLSKCIMAENKLGENARLDIMMVIKSWDMGLVRAALRTIDIDTNEKKKNSSFLMGFYLCLIKYGNIFSFSLIII
jgi:hypothetical protein